MSFEFEYEVPTLENLPDLAGWVAPFLEAALRETQRQVQGARQPKAMQDGYVVDQEQSSGNVATTLANDAGALVPSFIYGSRPHFPPWRDPALVEWANAHGVEPFVVALAVAKKGTPPHPEIDQILERSEDLIVREVEGALEQWVGAFS